MRCEIHFQTWQKKVGGKSSDQVVADVIEALVVRKKETYPTDSHSSVFLALEWAFLWMASGMINGTTPKRQADALFEQMRNIVTG